MPRLRGPGYPGALVGLHYDVTDRVVPDRFTVSSREHKRTLALERLHLVPQGMTNRHRASLPPLGFAERVGAIITPRNRHLATDLVYLDPRQRACLADAKPGLRT